MDDLNIRHIACGIQGDVYAFTVPHPIAPLAAWSEEDELIRLLESVDIRQETSRLTRPASATTAGFAAFDLPIEASQTETVDGEKQTRGHGRDDTGDKDGRVRAVKVVSAGRDGVMPRLRPHNVKVEMEVLMGMRHPRIIDLLAYRYDATRCEHLLVMPFLPYTLRQYLDSCPNLAQVDRSLLETDYDSRRGQSHGAIQTFRDRSSRFTNQILDALAYLHSEGVAHRDLKPENIMLDDKEDLVLIDFATAWVFGHDSAGEVEVRVEPARLKSGDEEAIALAMCQVEVGTGSYRPPELLFGPASYDATKIDIWTAGCIICELYRHQPPSGTSMPPIDNTSVYEDASDNASIVSSSASSSDIDTSESLEGPLFNSTFGDIGLAGSIFGLLGTPTAESWPSFRLLPDADKIPFHPRSPSPLAPRMPRLQVLPEADAITLLKVVERMLKLDPTGRCSAAAAREMLR